MEGNVSGDPRGPLLVGIDMGSTNVKAVIYEPSGRAVAQASVPAVTHVPQPTWAVYRPDELWALAVRVLREATAHVDAARIVGVAVASVGESGIPIERDGNATYDAIAWFDRRTIGQADWLARTIGEDALFAVSGLSLQAIFSLCKILWIKEHQPEAFARTVRWLHVADYIAFKLSGEMATDWSLASRTLMLDLRNRRWDDGVLRAAGLSPQLLAPLAASGTRIGGVTSEAAAATGLPAGCAVATGGHDHVCGALAAGAVKRGQMLDSMGTAEALFLAMDEPLTDPDLGRKGYAQGAHVAPGSYYVFGGVYTSGASVDWAHRLVGEELDRPTLLREAEAIPPGSLGVGFVPHLRLADPPHNDPRARAAFVGLTTDVRRGTLFRAALEGIAYEARGGIEPLLAYAGLEAPASMAIIGGSARNELLLRIKASVMNMPLEVLDLEEATALGAAILAGIGAGVYRDVEDALGQIHARPRTILPDSAAVPIYDRSFRDVFSAMYETLRPLNHRIHAAFAGDDPAD